MQFRRLRLVVVHVLHQARMFAGGGAKDFRKGSRGHGYLAGHPGQQVQPGGLLGEKAQLHVGLPVSGRGVHGCFLPALEHDDDPRMGFTLPPGLRAPGTLAGAGDGPVGGGHENGAEPDTPLGGRPL